jgi:hypothetical protein
MKLKNYSLAVAALLFFINGASVAQSAWPQLPDTPAGNQAKGWLEVFNAGDVEKRRAFLQKNYPSRLERFDRETEMRRGTGGFDVKKVEESTPAKVVLLIQERMGDQVARFTVEVEPAPPHAIKQFQFQVLPRVGEFAIPHLSESELATSLRKRVAELVALIFLQAQCSSQKTARLFLHKRMDRQIVSRKRRTLCRRASDSDR